LPRLQEFEGNGAYYAATEIEARYCRGTEAVIIGGGNSAGQAAMYLSRNAQHVHVVVRGPNLAASMSSYLSERLEADPRITIHYQSEVTGLEGADRLERLTVRNRSDGTEQRIDTRALFIMVGAAPNTAWLDGLVELDDKGFIRTGTDCGQVDAPYATSRPGIYAVGDVRARSVKRVASAVGEGSVVISHVYRHVRPGEG
jgi:thioredoxin reductase (NADPH)